MAERLPTADSLCDLKVARASKISRRKFSAAARRKPTAFTSAEMAALRCIAAARIGFLLAALHSVAKRVSRGQAYHPRRSVPVCPQTAPHASAATIRSFVPLGRAIAACPWSGMDRKTRAFWFWLEPSEARDSSPSSSKCGRAALAKKRARRCRWARLPRVDPLCDRMERGEEEASTGRRDAFQRSHFCRRAGP